MRASVALPALVALATLAPTPRASAANGSKPRTPVNWTQGECATIVDRSTTTTVHFDYTIPNEESYMRTEDEVDDSRTHQFFAVRKQDFEGVPPLWISQADIDRAKLVDPEVDPTLIQPHEIFDVTDRFAPADWVRITPDDARVPITYEQAAMGVDWDVANVEPGTYEIWGYTWEPLGNLWERRGGFVKVIASADARVDAGPSISIAKEEAIITAGAAYTLPGCADVSPGSTVTVEWGKRVGTPEPQWEIASEDEPIESGPLTIEFVPPDEAGDSSIAIRATVSDAQGRTYVAYAPAAIQVRPNPNPDDEDDGGCAVDRSASAWWALVPLLFARRRRR
jgi:hypothetical protein